MPTSQRLESFSLELAGEQVLLHPFGSIFWTSASALVLSDLHFGKEASFRKAGLPVPDGGMEEDLLKITHLLHETKAERLIITGDLLHARTSSTPEVTQSVATWRHQFPELSIQLTLGNHDRHVRSIPMEWKFEIHPTRLVIPPFVFQHDPSASPDGYVIAGHLHPVFSTGSTKRRRSLRLPCFHVTREYAVLPAFGHFTGGHPVRRESEDRLFAIAGDRIVEV
ncbi:MAG: ligase-associated DNA damage response endonuclease PdeM [Verrucomicrobiota bacterium]